MLFLNTICKAARKILTSLFIDKILKASKHPSKDLAHQLAEICNRDCWQSRGKSNKICLTQ